MNISTIQKRKFLNNIYKLLYSSGKAPSDQEIKNIFGKYFSANQFGVPVNVDYSLLQSIDLTDVDVINNLMATTLLNMEVLHDCILENNEELFSIVNTLNSKLESLKVKRRALEAKVDELIFINNNSDGYYYSFLDNYFNVDNIDLKLTSAVVDTGTGQVRIPKITSTISNALSIENIRTANVTYSLTVNNSTVLSNQRITNFENVFDGLNDTYWNYDHSLQSPSVVSLKLDISIPSNFNISKLSGKLLTTTPITVQAICTPIDAQVPEYIATQDSKSEYNQFSFSIPATAYGKISLTFVKIEPDRIIASSQSPYIYSFGLRELIIGADYHDTSATLISKPISIPTSDNSNLLIAAVGLEAQTQVLSGTEAKFYVCENTVENGGIADYNWIQVEPSILNGGGVDKLINFAGSNYITKYIDVVDSDLTLIDKNSTSPNINEKNPSLLPDSNKSVYRVCAVDSYEKFIDPFILSGINSMRHYYTLPIATIRSGSTVSYYKSLDQWDQKINNNIPGEIYSNVLLDQGSQISINNSSAINGIIKFNIYCEQSIKVNHSINKSSDAFNLAIYLNGTLIADLPSGRSFAYAEWSLLKGSNSVIITYDKSFTGFMNFNIMSGARLSDYGNIYLDYYRYLDPLEFKNREISNQNVFTIDNFYGRKEILSSKEIGTKSLIRYYTNNNNLYNSIRYRIDLRRYNNPLQTPIIDAVRIKFKHIDN